MILLPACLHRTQFLSDSIFQPFLKCILKTLSFATPIFLNPLSENGPSDHHLRTAEALYYGYPIAKKMSKFIVHRRGVPLIIHKKIPYIVHKRMDVGGNGFDGDTFSSGFGDFSTTRKKKMGLGGEFGDGDTFSQGFGDFSTAKRMDTSFHGDTFSSGFGDFSTV